ncbi:MAG: GNAT family N-acetyltransferase [Marivita sp.]|uniref:GNAT family N-acetyltransferase n=1 Tax=Marivita sp. TaxID=2003365 RepID=UPI003EF6419E
MDCTFTIREMSKEDFEPLFQRHVHAAFASDHSYTLRDALDDTEQEQMRNLDSRLGDALALYLGAFDQDDHFVGWAWGKQEPKAKFCMVNSGVVEGQRRKGIYSALVQSTVETISDRGFQVIYSRHCATNNAVIIPKLKAGFVISKFEIDDSHGVLVHLHYYTNKTRRKVMDYRTGSSAPDDDLKRLFKL